MEELLPPLIKAGISVVKSLVKILPSIIKVLIAEIPMLIREIGEAIKDAFGAEMPPILGNLVEGFINNADTIAKIVPFALSAAAGFKVLSTVFSKIDSLSSVLGKSSEKATNPLESFSKINVKSILKGILNITLVIGAFTLIAAAVMAVSPYLSELTDAGSFLKVIGAIAVLGTVGAALTQLTKIAANISIGKTLKGLVNMGLAIGGMTLIFLVVAEVSKTNFNLKKIVEFGAAITVLGGVGAILAAFAGIIGVIPFALVISGLANIALVLAGFGVIVAAFGALAQIPGINDFIDSGGELLANLCEQLGRAAGALISGLGVGLTQGLPDIGANLSAFAESLEPLFTITEGADLGGIGDFFVSFGEFMVMMAANDILSLFTGGTDLGQLGQDLSKFAISSSLFFMTAAMLPQEGFTGAKSLFETLSHINNLPKSGGMAQWFTGEVDYDSLASGLVALSSPGVVGFFNTMASLPQEGFTGAKLLFESIADISNVPNTGGIAQWFSGTNGYADLAAGLLSLSSPGIVLFYTTMALLPTEGFDNAKLLFESIADIGNVPNTGGIAQWFSGENDFEGLAEKLPKFGKGMAAFYKNISNIKDFTKITSLFKAMKGIGEAFPNTGGLGQLFTGENDISGVGESLKSFGEDTGDFFKQVNDLKIVNLTGLFNALKTAADLPVNNITALDFEGLAAKFAALNDDGLIDFFKVMGGLPKTSFENTAYLFKSLEYIENVPKSGSSLDFSGLAAGFITLKNGDIIHFFQLMGQLPAASFENIAGLFKSLAYVRAVPDGERITSIGTGLKQFGTDTTDFFGQIETIDTTKLNSLWNSLKEIGNVTVKSLSDIMDKNISSVVKKVSKLPELMAEGIRNSGDSLSKAIVEMWQKAVKASAVPVNKLIDGANWILKQFGSSKTIAKWSAYAKGTEGHKGGNALVNDGRGAELVQMPNGESFIPKGRNIFIPNAPKGMKVLSAEDTAALMGRKTPTFHYADGNIDIYDYIDDAAGLINSVKNKYVNYKGVKGLALTIGKGMVETVSGEMVSWAEGLFKEFGAMSLANYNASAGVEQWRSTVIQALKMEGLYSEANVARTLYQMQTESGGNPYAINLWDSNAKKGVPSKGLMQVIDPTFRAYARPGYNTNIYDPLSNILAAVRYARARYGSLDAAFRGVGYAEGGIAYKPSVFGEDGAEMAIPLTLDKRDRALDLWAKTGNILGADLGSYTPENAPTSNVNNNVVNDNYNFELNINVEGGGNDRKTARNVKNAVKEGIKEFMDSFRNSNRAAREY